MILESKKGCSIIMSKVSNLCDLLHTKISRVSEEGLPNQQVSSERQVMGGNKSLSKKSQAIDMHFVQQHKYKDKQIEHNIIQLHRIAYIDVSKQRF